MRLGKVIPLPIIASMGQGREDLPWSCTYSNDRHGQHSRWWVQQLNQLPTFLQQSVLRIKPLTYLRNGSHLDSAILLLFLLASAFHSCLSKQGICYLLKFNKPTTIGSTNKADAYSWGRFHWSPHSQLWWPCFTFKSSNLNVSLRICFFHCHQQNPNQAGYRKWNQPRAKKLCSRSITWWNAGPKRNCKASEIPGQQIPTTSQCNIQDGHNDSLFAPPPPHAFYLPCPLYWYSLNAKKPYWPALSNKAKGEREEMSPIQNNHVSLCNKMTWGHVRFFVFRENTG